MALGSRTGGGQSHTEKLPEIVRRTGVYFTRCLISNQPLKQKKKKFAYLFLVICCYFFVSGGDDRRALVWKYQKALNDLQPHSLESLHLSNIFCLAFNEDNSQVISGGKVQYVHDCVIFEFTRVLKYL